MGKRLQILVLPILLSFGFNLFGQDKEHGKPYQFLENSLYPSVVRMDSAYKLVMHYGYTIDPPVYGSADGKPRFTTAFSNLVEDFYSNKEQITFTTSNAISYIESAIQNRNYKAIPLLIQLVEIEYRKTGQLDELVTYFKNLIPRLSSTIEDSIILANSYLSLGEFFNYAGDYLTCVSATLKAFQLFETNNVSGYPLIHASTLLGHAHEKVGNNAEGEKYYKKSIVACRQSGDSTLLSYNYMKMMYLNIKKRLYDDALQNIDSAIFVSNSMENEIDLAKNKLAKSILFGELNRHQDALDLQLAIFNKFEKAPPMESWYCYACSSIGNTYLQLGNYEQALSFGLEGLNYADLHAKSIKDNLEIIYQAWEGLGIYNKAYTAYQEYITLRDSLSNQSKIAESTRLELENHFERERLSDSLLASQQKFERELAFQSELNRQKNNRNIFIVIGLGAIALSLGLFQRLRFIRKTEAALKEKNNIIEKEKEKAQASEKAKQLFLANMSHEIRTPMNAIKGMTDILLRRKPNKNQLEYLNGIKQSSDSLLVIINDILDISKIEAGKIELENISFSIEELIQSLRTVIQFKAEEKGLELKTYISNNIPQVLGDPTRLRQILINLVGNAIKFTEKGLVNISVNSEYKNDEKIELHFIVSDTGIGIDESRIEQIFNSFEQAYSDTSRKFGGTGLGLSITKKLVNIQGGKIWVESEKEKGSQFHFTIPYLAAKEEKVKIIQTKNDVAKSLKGIRILLVEDNAFNAIVAQEELGDAIEELHIEVAENGAIALEKIKTNDFDIALMDIQMPKMNGYEATKKIRSFSNEKSKIPIIAMTANVMKEEVDKCYETGMDDFIGKPFNTEELLNKIYKLKIRM